MSPRVLKLPKINTLAVTSTKTNAVRIESPKSELIPFNPDFANTEVSPAKNADTIAYIIQVCILIIIYKDANNKDLGFVFHSLNKADS